ncbi:hypothetical protein MNBD_GAMMA17-1437 [hydrothermal vent metagenome]|uniref:Uncharacterized protein n=1 Tax=hydrothermal vent metagenome TaxID=652676 RepID=A0A3B0ZQN3_9ZZZZ
MSLDRRQFTKLMVGGMASSLLSSSALAQVTAKNNIKAIAFDGFPIFDPRPILGLSTQLFPVQGKKLAKLWFKSAHLRSKAKNSSTRPFIRRWNLPQFCILKNA